MNQFFVNLFTEETVKNEIALFNIWHIMYIVLIIGMPIGLYFIFRNRTQNTKDLVLKIFAYLVPAVYIADFFIMPLSRGDIDIDKLPFHICTLMAFFIPFAQFNKKFEPIKHVIVTLSLIASLMYITYPGSAIGEIGAFSYKVAQTFAYHGLMYTWGFLNLAFGNVKLEFKKIWKELVGLCIIALWAAFGNNVYSTEARGFDWFFITGSTFPFIPTWAMPAVVIVATFAMCAIIYGLYYAVVAINKKIKAKKQSKATAQQ